MNTAKMAQSAALLVWCLATATPVYSAQPTPLLKEGVKGVRLLEPKSALMRSIFEAWPSMQVECAPIRSAMESWERCYAFANAQAGNREGDLWTYAGQFLTALNFEVREGKVQLIELTLATSTEGRLQAADVINRLYDAVDAKYYKKLTVDTQITKAQWQSSQETLTVAGRVGPYVVVEYGVSSYMQESKKLAPFVRRPRKDDL